MIDARENINPYELRLGNWVEDEDDSHLQFQVDHIEQGKDLVSDLVFINGRHHLAILPIPLTPEILEKAGFVWVNILHDGTAVYKGKPYLYFKDGIGTISAAAIRIKYLHQLQNLFWCMVGKELEIKI